MKVFNDTTALAAATLTAGQMVSVKEVGEYRIKASGSGITLANGNIAVPVASGTAVNVKQFGAVGDGVTDDTAAIQAAIDYAESLVVNQPDASGEQIGGTTIFMSGIFKISEPLTITTDNVSIQGDGGTTILPYYTTSTGYNGAKPVFIVGTGTSWLGAGTISSTTKYNKIDSVKIVRVGGYLPFIGVLLTGTRNATVSNCLMEEGYAGILMENTSEFYIEQVSAIGCTYGFIGDNRANRTTSEVVLGVANVDNDVSSGTFKVCTAYYPQHTGFLMINTGTVHIDSSTIGRFSENPSGSPALGFSAESAGIHIWGGSAHTKWTRSMLVNNIVFEAEPSTPVDCIRLESTTSNDPIIGCTFNNCHVQTFAADQEGGVNIATLLRYVQSGSGDIRGVVLRDSGFTYQSGGNYYGDLVQTTGGGSLHIENCYPSVSFATSSFPSAVSFSPARTTEYVELDAFPPTGWTAGGVTTGCAKLGDSNGTPAYLSFTGDVGSMAINKRHTFRNTKQDLNAVYITFMAQGDADLFLLARINGDSGSLTSTIDATNKSRYGQALYTDKTMSTTWKRYIWVIKPNSVNYGFDNVDLWIGRDANASPSTYVNIQDIRVGYLQGATDILNPF